MTDIRITLEIGDQKYGFVTNTLACAFGELGQLVESTIACHFGSGGIFTMGVIDD